MADDRSKRRSRTKADLVDLVYKSHGGITKHEAAEIVESIFQTMKSSLLEGQAVKIQNFGVFEVVPRQGRMGVDPSSGERIFIPPRNGLSFRPANRLKQAVFKRGSGKDEN